MKDGIIKNYVEIAKTPQYRSILLSLIKRRLINNYKNTTIGFGWHFAIPLVMLSVYYIIFTQVNVAPIDNFIVYIASGLFAFMFMVNGLYSGATSITDNRELLKKLPFPKELYVIANVIGSFIIMIIGYALVFILIIVTGTPITSYALLLVPIFIIMFVFVLGYSLLLSSFNVYFRDLQYFIGSIQMIFFFITPMYFLTSTISGALEIIVWANPFTYFIEMIHDVLYFGKLPDLNLIIVSLTMTILSFIIGNLVFYRLKRKFVERL